MNILTDQNRMELYVWTEDGGKTCLSARELEEGLFGMDSGVVVLDGMTACGKTRLLKSLRCRRGGAMAVVSYEDVTVEYVRLLNKHGGDSKERMVALLGAYPALAVEDVDFLRGKPFTQMDVGDILRAVSGNSLVILTGFRIRESVPELLERLPGARYYQARICGGL